MTGNLKISVITPSYNSGAGIERAIQSVLGQDYGNYEHIVVDGGSGDDTVDILRRYPHLKWVSERDGGQVDAMNKGFSMSTGDVVAYLNADDYYCPGAFSAVIPHFERGERMVVGKVLVRSERPEGVREWINNPRTDFDSMIRHWEPDAFCVNPVGYFFRRELQAEIGGFNEENDTRHDLEFLLELSLRCDARKIDKVLGVFNHSFDTKTGLSQLKPGSWSLDSRPFIDRLAENLPAGELKQFRLDRERGYQLRRHWAMQDCFARGMTRELIEEGEIVFLPEELPDGSVQYNHPAAIGDWVIVLLSSGGVADGWIYQELKKLPLQTLPALVYHVAGFGKACSNKGSSQGLLTIDLALNDIYGRHGNMLKWKIISGVREPITQDSIGSQLDCFDPRLKDALGIDEYPYGLNAGKGYVIVRKDNVEMLIYRCEDLPRIFPDAMEEFLGIDGLKSPKSAVKAGKSPEGCQA